MTCIFMEMCEGGDLLGVSLSLCVCVSLSLCVSLFLAVSRRPAPLSFSPNPCLGLPCVRLWTLTR